MTADTFTATAQELEPGDTIATGRGPRTVEAMELTTWKLTRTGRRQAIISTTKDTRLIMDSDELLEVTRTRPPCRPGCEYCGGRHDYARCPKVSGWKA